MHQAIYRQYRPKNFDEIIGQSQVTEVLKNQVKNNLIGHAYIFSGTRGTGKTSCAKVFARAVNCLNPVNGSPCNECDNCKLILSEETFDVVEMDAASNRRIEDIRDLRDKVVYPPAKLKYKVYIIDEAHMITNDGFNALLKIMEEPPKHLIFVLATTEIEKIPQTILSRCQRYGFKRLDNIYIIDNISKIIKDLNVEIEEEAVNIIANEADGAMRDALSLLDQVVSLGKNKVTTEDLQEDLGLVAQDSIFKLVDAIIEKDFNKTLTEFSNASSGKVIGNLFKELSIHYRNLMLVKNNLEEFVDEGPNTINKYKNQSENISMNQILESISILMEFEIKLRNTENPILLGELLVSRLIDYVNYNDFKSKINFLEEKVKNLENKLSNLKFEDFESSDIIDIAHIEPKSIKKTKNTVVKESKIDNITEPINSNKNIVESNNNVKSNIYEETKYWGKIVESMPTPMLKNFINSSTYRFIENNRLVILFNAEDSKMKLVCSNIDIIKESVKNIIGENIDVYITLESKYGDLMAKRVENNMKIIKDLFGEENIEIIGGN